MLIVTAYYNIPSKQPKEFYINNIKLFFKYIKNKQVIFFTDKDCYSELKPFAGENIIFYLLSFENLDIFNIFPSNFWKEQIKLDPEEYHTWQLGALWANKSWFVKKTIEMNMNYDWYMWVDAGCIRDERWENILNDFGNRSYDLKKGVYMQLLNNFPNNKTYFRFVRDENYIAGSHILFHKDYIDKYLEEYNKTIKDYISNSVPIIMDQYIMATIALRNSFIIPILYDQKIDAIDKWFFFFYIF